MRIYGWTQQSEAAFAKVHFMKAAFREGGMRMDDRELERLIAKYEALVYTVVSGILTSRADREEAAADTFVSLWRDGRFP